jgi:starch-binding outer membrane protein, SusD/RagB family
MTKPFSRQPIGASGVRGLVLAAAAMVAAQSCTDLTEVPRSSLTPSTAFQTPDDINAGVASVYASLRGAPENAYFNLNEVTSNEIIVPTRGQDWYDNGVWLELYRQTWSANSGSANGEMNGAWNDAFTGISRANLVLNAIQGSAAPGQEVPVAELRALRAYYYYLLMDLFGGVPIVTDTKVEPRPRNTRAEVFTFVEKELTEARAALPDRVAASSYGRVTKGAVDAILASMYLNAQVYNGTVTAAGLQRGTARWQDAVTAADRILNSGVYSLANRYADNFSTTNEGSPENIFVVVHVAQAGLGNTFPMRTLHYNQLAPSPWNGFAAVAETYTAFDAADQRRNVWLVGPQKSFNTGEDVKDRAGAPLVFTVSIANPEQASEAEGPRLNKYPPLAGAPSGDAHPNDYVLFRLGEIYLIKAEALNELGRTADALALVNALRAGGGRFNPPKPLSTALNQTQARQAIFDERLFELAAEGKRRQDLIRAGAYTDARRFKTVQAAYKVLFPIPQTQIQTNPLLTQNPGY